VSWLVGVVEVVDGVLCLGRLVQIAGTMDTGTWDSTRSAIPIDCVAGGERGRIGSSGNTTFASDVSEFAAVVAVFRNATVASHMGGVGSGRTAKRMVVCVGQARRLHVG
jgi:hypothetical protein